VDDFTEAEPGFALNCGLLALHWICAGRAYDPTMSEVRAIFDGTMKAGEIAGCKVVAMESVRKLLVSFPEERLVRGALKSVLG
jgi:hypothetical protein